MGWRQLNNNNFLKPKEFKKGDVMVEGTYVGRRPTQYGEAFDFKTDAGETVSLHGYMPIIQQMESVEPNTLCRVTYDGTKKSKNKFVYHNFNVEISDEAAPKTSVSAAGKKKTPVQPPVDDDDLDAELEELDDLEEDAEDCDVEDEEDEELDEADLDEDDEEEEEPPKKPSKAVKKPAATLNHTMKKRK